MRRWCFALVLLALALVAVLPAAALEVPTYPERVNDRADMLDADAEARLGERLAALERSTGAQVVVLTIPSLEGEVLEDYSLRVADEWGLGRADRDDGLLFLVARDDRKMRFEVGYGLEGTIPDVIAGRILDGAVRPRFRDGDFAGGIEAGVEAVAGAIEGDPSAVPPERAVGDGDDFAGGQGLMVLVIFLTVIIPFSTAGIFSKGCGGWMLFAFLSIFWTVFPVAVLGAPWGLVPVGLWVAVGGILRLLFAGSRGDALRQSHPWLVSSGLSGGGWSSRGGGGFGGGGFSGGGGSFGGGGASSSW
jgi:uncharacterized protein